MRHSTRRARVEFLFESRPIIIKAEQEVLLDIEQEIITQPKNNNNKTSTDTKEKGKTLLDIPVAGICSQNCELARPAWTRNCEVVASVCRPQQHHCQPHNNILPTTSNICRNNISQQGWALLRPFSRVGL